MNIILASIFLGVWFSAEACVLGFCLWINHASKINQKRTQALKRKLARLERLVAIQIRDSKVRFHHDMCFFRDYILTPELRKYGLAVKQDRMGLGNPREWHVQIIWEKNPFYDPQYRNHCAEFITCSCADAGLATLDSITAVDQVFKHVQVDLVEYVRNWSLDAQNWYNLTQAYKSYIPKEWALTTYTEMKKLADKKRTTEWADMPRMFITLEGESVDWWLWCSNCGGGVEDYPNAWDGATIYRNQRKSACSFCGSYTGNLYPHPADDIPYFQNEKDQRK